MAKRKIYVILNGKAGRRGKDFSVGEIERCFKENDPEVEVEFGLTERAMHAAELARNAAAKGEYYAIVAAGGDGTVNEVCNGLVNSGARMGIIPNGSTNVFCQEMKISSDIAKATKNILDGIPMKIDAGLAGDRYFIWMCGVGVEAKIAHLVDPKIKKRFGVLAYVVSALRQAFDLTFKIMYLKLDNVQMTFNTFNTIIGNATSFDGIFGIRSAYSIRDGYLDVCVQQRRSVFGFMGVFIRFIKGRRDYYRTADSFSSAHCRVKKLRVETVPNEYFHCDGEVVGTTPVDISICEGALTLIVPPETAGKALAQKWQSQKALPEPPVHAG